MSLSIIHLNLGKPCLFSHSLDILSTASFIFLNEEYTRPAVSKAPKILADWPRETGYAIGSTGLERTVYDSGSKLFEAADSK